MDKPIIEFEEKVINGNESNNINNQFDNDKSKIKNKRLYELKSNGILYKIQLEIDSNYLYIKVFELIENKISPFYFKNKFDLNKMLSIFKLSQDQYNNLNKIMELFNDAYDKNNLRISINGNNLNIIVKIRNNSSIEIDCSINLIKNETTISDKFEIVIKEIKNIKNSKNNILNNEKLLFIEKTIKDIQDSTRDKLKCNEELIIQLNFNIVEMNYQIRKNDEEIKALKSDLSKIKYDLKYKYDKYLKNINLNIDAKDIHKNIIQKNGDIQKKNSKLPKPIRKLSNKFPNINEKKKILRFDFNLDDQKNEEGKNFNETQNIFEFLSRLNSSHILGNKINLESINIDKNNLTISHEQINSMKNIEQDILRDSAKIENNHEKDNKNIIINSIKNNNE